MTLKIRAVFSGIVFSGALLLFLVSEALAWGPDGHRLVAWIAELNLLPAVKEKIRWDFNIKNLVFVAPWADEVKKVKTHQKPWHYANIKPGEWTYDRKRDCPDGECVVEKVLEFGSVLVSPKRSNRVRARALKYLVHFVGDIHQPLHLGNKRDRGGNNIAFKFNGRETNLHMFWDSGLVSLRKISLLQYASQLNRRISKEDIKKWLAADVPSWANESRKLALSQGYGIAVDGRDRLAKKYVDASLKIAEEQWSKAGIRLAALLNRSLRN